MSHIICYDPRRLTPIGQVVEDAEVARLEASRVGVLPVERNRIFAGPNAGHVCRLFGKDGWRYTGNRPERGCHVLLDVTSGVSKISWFARLEPIAPMQLMSGSFKLIRDTTSNQISGGLRPDTRVDRIPSDAPHAGGLNLYGRCTLSTSIGGVMALSLHGVANNVRCVAFAVSCHAP